MKQWNLKESSIEVSKCYPGAKVQCHLRINWECQPGCTPISEECAQRQMGSNFWQGLSLWGDDYKRLECFNGVLKGARSLPIMAMVKYTWFKLNAYFNDRCNKSIAQLNSREKWCKYALDISSWEIRRRRGITRWRHWARNNNHIK